MTLEPTPTGPIGLPAPRHTDVRAWRAAVFTLFLANGLLAGSWASRIPAVAEALDLGVGALGLLITVSPLGALAGLVLSSVVIDRLGERRAATLGQLVFVTGVITIGVGGGLTGQVAFGIVGLLLYGLGMSTTNIVINLEAASLDRRTGRALMPVYHASWSVGALGGAGLGAVAAAAHLPIAVHLPSVAVVVLAASLVAIRAFPRLRHDAAKAPVSSRERLSVWRESRTLLLGLLVLAAAFNEGTANNWLAVSLVDGRDWTAGDAAAAYAVFVGSMTVGRFAGGALVDRVGRVAALRGGFAFAAAGILLLVFGHEPYLVYVAVALWGLGAALGYPLAVSAAADEPRNAAARVAAITTLATIAGLACPGLIGALGEAVGLPEGLVAIAALALVGAVLAGAARRSVTLPNAERR